MTLSNWILMTWHLFWHWGHSLEAQHAITYGNKEWFAAAKGKAYKAQRKAQRIRMDAIYGVLR